MEKTFEFKNATIKEEVWRDFLKKAWFCHESIREVSSPEIGVVIIDVGAEAVDDEQLYPLLQKTLQESAKISRLGLRILRNFKSNTQQQFFGDVMESLLKRGDLYQFDKGVYGYSGILKKLMERLDSAFVALADQYQPIHYEFPSAISWKVLNRANYPAEFPQNLTFLGNLTKNLQAYNHYSQNPVPNPKDIQPNGLLFAPTVCIQLYEILRNQSLPSKYCATVKGKCFRNEYIKTSSLERLREFWMREIILIGDKDFVLEAREDIMNKTAALVEELGLTGVLEVASDPFFTSQYLNKTFFQKVSELKYELNLDLNSDGNAIAVSSFNIHQTHFTDAFTLKSNENGELWTGCCAYGIERFAYAILCQYGIDPQYWPEPFAKLLPK